MNVTLSQERPGPDFDFGASPVLVRLPGGRDLIIAGQKSGMVHALDPDHDGAVLSHDPLALADALRKLEARTAVVPMQVAPALAPLTSMSGVAE